MGKPAGAWRDARPERESAASPTGGVRKSENRKRWAAIQPMAWHMCKALVTKFGAAMGRGQRCQGRAQAQRLAVENGGLQNWPRWYGMPGCAAAWAAACRVQPFSRRAMRNSEITGILKRR